MSLVASQRRHEIVVKCDQEFLFENPFLPTLLAAYLGTARKAGMCIYSSSPTGGNVRRRSTISAM